MRRWYYSIFILFLVYSQACKSPTQPLTRIAFGSCSNEELHEQMWTDIIEQKPQLCILLGDNIYGDTHDMADMRRQYDIQKNMPEYQALLKQCPVIGTWDDHDYGKNDGGKFYTMKKESKEEFLRFLDIPADDPIRTHEGVYGSYNYGPEGKKIKVILLDLRYFRDSTVKSTVKGRRYDQNPDGDIMGEAQWAWFEKELMNSDAQVHIIGSSIQFIPIDHGFEKWDNFPKARQRMLDLLVKYKSKKLFIISGDRHIAEVSRMNPEGLTGPLYDITSSGLTHTWDLSTWKDMPLEEVNQFRVGELIIQKNFGMILVDWSGQEPVVTIEIRGKDNQLWMPPFTID